MDRNKMLIHVYPFATGCEEEHFLDEHALAQYI